MAQTTAQRSTDLLRTSDHQPYKRLRELLIGQGADPQTDVLADFFSNDVDQEFGVLVTTAQRVFTFSMHYGRRGDLNAQVADASIHEWNEITKRWRSSPLTGECQRRDAHARRPLDGAPLTPLSSALTCR